MLKALTVKQPLPLPKGVSNLAVGGKKRVHAMPEPEMAGLMLFMLFVLSYQRYQGGRRGKA